MKEDRERRRKGTSTLPSRGMDDGVDEEARSGREYNDSFVLYIGLGVKQDRERMEKGTSTLPINGRMERARQREVEGNTLIVLSYIFAMKWKTTEKGKKSYSLPTQGTMEWARKRERKGNALPASSHIFALGWRKTEKGRKKCHRVIQTSCAHLFTTYIHKLLDAQGLLNHPVYASYPAE